MTDQIFMKFYGIAGHNLGANIDQSIRIWLTFTKGQGH